MFEIYCITNTINNKKYVGKTSQGRDVRWANHIEFARKKKGSYFQNAIRKYGPDAFAHETLATADTEEDAYDLERFWILLLRSHDPETGYNATYGGEGFSTGDKNPNFGKHLTGPDNPSYGRPVADEVRQKISQSLTGGLVGT